MIDEERTEVALIHTEMQRLADAEPKWAKEKWRSAITGVSVQLAELVYRFRDRLSDNERRTIIGYGAALVRADAELTALGISDDSDGAND